LTFDLQHTDQNTKARAGKITTDHGEILTPIFMPVGTAGTVKSIQQRDLVSTIKAQIILGNTYHLYLRPGTNVLETAGGLHKFMQWDKPILTDSGGYQVFSLSGTRKIKEDGAWFQSHIDGSKHLFSPESVINTQRKIGADITMAFDECTPYPCDERYATNSMHLTHRWLERCIEAHRNTPMRYDYNQTFFPIVQGSVYPHLRQESAAYIAATNCEGNAIGGLSVGEPAEDMYNMTELVCGILPTNKPRYLMGVGTPVNILEGIERGVDMFDCVMPTRNARNGMLFTTQGTINIRNEKWKNDMSVIDAGLDNNISNHYSKAYLRHLMTSGEMLASQIASIQNLSLYLWLAQNAREQILQNTYQSWKKTMVEQLGRRL
jgi:queuine tRNA-ribosyltransferase